MAPKAGDSAIELSRKTPNPPFKSYEGQFEANSAVIVGTTSKPFSKPLAAMEERTSLSNPPA